MYKGQLSSPFFVILSLLLATMCVSSASAQFVQTSPGVLQSADGRAKVVTSFNVPGLFILLGSPIDLQVFDPAQLEQSPDPKLSSHLFIEYSAESDRYVSLHVGSNEFRIKGGFTVKVGQLRVTVDNNNPYLSLVYENNSAGTKPADTNAAILGFRGIDLVVNKNGQKQVALLEANQFNQFKGIIEPYSIEAENLLFKGTAFKGSAVGVEIEPAKSLCLQTGTAILEQSEINRLKKISDKNQSAKELQQLLSNTARADAFKGSLLLRIERNQIIGLDYERNKVRIFRPLSKSARPICTVEEVNLDEG